MRFVSQVLLAGILSAAAFTAGAASVTYKWKDDDGVIQYTETKPADRDYEVIRVRVDNTPRPQATVAQPAGNEDKAEEQKTGTAEAREQERYAKNCKIATKNLETLNNSNRILVKDEEAEGGQRYMTDEERTSRLEETQKQVTEFCGKTA